MKTIAISLALAMGCMAARQDLTGKVFTFPLESNTAHVKLTPALNKILFNVTVCLRFFSDHSKTQSLFSLATPTHTNGFVLYKPRVGLYQVHNTDTRADFWGLPDELNHWNSLCATWDSSTGLTQVWVNGNPSSRKALQPGGSIAGAPSIVLGQDQDSYGGGFSTNDAFVGQITDVHMWDRVLGYDAIQNYSDKLAFSTGNYLSWQALEFTRHGYVVIENNNALPKRACST